MHIVQNDASSDMFKNCDGYDMLLIGFESINYLKNPNPIPFTLVKTQALALCLSLSLFVVSHHLCHRRQPVSLSLAAHSIALPSAFTSLPPLSLSNITLSLHSLT